MDLQDHHYSILYSGIKDLITNEQSSFKMKKSCGNHKANLNISVSYINISDKKIVDNFNFDGNMTNEFSKLKLKEYPDEIIIEGEKEILIRSVIQFESLMRLILFHNFRYAAKLKQNSKKIYNSHKNHNFKNEIFQELVTVKIFETDDDNSNNRKNLTKYNFLLYKAYDISNSSINSNTNSNTNKCNLDSQMYSINTKQNFNFFQSLINSNFRNCRIIRSVKVIIYINYRIHLYLIIILL
jgi:hypothetical protein